MVRAKFKVNSKLQKGSDEYEVTLYPVTGGTAENETFYKWTPAGKIEMATINKAAADQFEVGKSMYVDFTPADE